MRKSLGERNARVEDPLWYKDAIIYELPIKSFYDSNGDGIGDLQGLREKLDYVEDLGVTALWVLPFYPSPLKDDGYDISDYFNVHPDYGSLRDFREFLRSPQTGHPGHNGAGPKSHLRPASLV